MSNNLITIVDYGCGNIYSLNRILEKLDCKVQITDDPEKVSKADKIILPGVGAYSIGMENLKKNDLIQAINVFLKKGNSLLGICLGMQLLMKSSQEFGNHEGLGLIDGKVVSLDKNENFPIPHIGWSQINIELSKNSLISNIKDKSYFYFIHSFKVIVENEIDTVCNTEYGINNFCSVVNHQNIFGTQFHPEKSGKVGEKLIQNFLNLKI